MYIRTDSLTKSLDIINRLGLTLGQDCTLEDCGVSIAIPLNQRIDHDIILTPEQCNQLTGLGIRFNAEVEAAADDVRAQIDAAIAYGKAKGKMRQEIIAPLLETIVAQSKSFLMYQAQYPDGRSVYVRNLIHYTHPASPEELWLREHRVTCRFIYRFHVVGLDDAEWAAQNEPRREMGDRVWREVLSARI